MHMLIKLQGYADKNEGTRKNYSGAQCKPCGWLPMHMIFTGKMLHDLLLYVAESINSDR
jgi:hypothetical protein